MTQEIERIRAALEAGPTPGPWNNDSDPVKNDNFNRVRYQVTALGKTVTMVYYSSYEGGPTCAAQDAAYIAACNPDAMQSVLAHIDAQRAEIAAYDTAVQEYRQQCIDNHTEIDRLTAEADERLKDAVAQAMEIESLRGEYQNACKLVADMHAAAVGQCIGPKLGVVEDVEQVRLELERLRTLREQAQPVLGPDNPSWHYERLDRLLCMTLSAESYADYLYSLNIVAAPQAQPEHATDSEPWDGHKFKEVSRGVWLCECGKQITESAT